MCSHWMLHVSLVVHTYFLCPNIIEEKKRKHKQINENNYQNEVEDDIEQKLL